MRLTNPLTGVQIKVDDETGAQLLADGVYRRLDADAGQGGGEPVKKLTAAQQRKADAKAKADAEAAAAAEAEAKAKADADAGQGDNDPDGAANDGSSDTGSGAAADAG